MLIPLNNQQAQDLKTAFDNNKVSYEGTSVKGIGATAFWAHRVGAPAIYVLTNSDVTFNMGATTNGTNSASEAKLAGVATKVVSALALFRSRR
jgi:cobyrinic acid a,c-diamide synthase